MLTRALAGGTVPSVPAESRRPHFIINAKFNGELRLEEKVSVDTVLALTSFVFGLAFGSFLNVCIYRLPRGLSVTQPARSICPSCQQKIAFYDNVPLLSWVLLRGRCRRCKAVITPRYLLVELLTGILFLGCYWHFGPTLAMLKYCVFGFLLLGLIFT